MFLEKKWENKNIRAYYTHTLVNYAEIALKIIKPKFWRASVSIGAKLVLRFIVLRLLVLRLLESVNYMLSSLHGTERSR